MIFTNTITIDRRRADVFAFLARLENVPRWNYAIAETHKITTGPVAVGTQYRQTRTLPTPREEMLEVVGFEPDRWLAIRGGLGPFAGEVTYRLELADGATVLSNAMDLQPAGPARLLAPLMAPRVKSAVAENLNVLKRILEGEASVT
jgi:hypothetical protein